MASSMELASIFGPVLVIIGIWTIFYKDQVKTVYESLKKTPGLLYIGGLINLIIGLTIIQISPHWQMRSSTLVTLLGWFMLIRGLVIFFLPNVLLKFAKMQSNAYVLSGLTSVIWGLALCWYAFI